LPDTVRDSTLAVHRSEFGVRVHRSDSRDKFKAEERDIKKAGELARRDQKSEVVILHVGFLLRLCVKRILPAEALQLNTPKRSTV